MNLSLALSLATEQAKSGKRVYIFFKCENYTRVARHELVESLKDEQSLIFDSTKQNFIYHSSKQVFESGGFIHLSTYSHNLTYGLRADLIIIDEMLDDEAVVNLVPRLNLNGGKMIRLQKETGKFTS